MKFRNKTFAASKTRPAFQISCENLKTLAKQLYRKTIPKPHASLSGCLVSLQPDNNVCAWYEILCEHKNHCANRSVFRQRMGGIQTFPSKRSDKKIYDALDANGSLATLASAHCAYCCTAVSSAAHNRSRMHDMEPSCGTMNIQILKYAGRHSSNFLSPVEHLAAANGLD